MLNKLKFRKSIKKAQFRNTKGQLISKVLQDSQNKIIQLVVYNKVPSFFDLTSFNKNSLQKFRCFGRFEGHLTY